MKFVAFLPLIFCALANAEVIPSTPPNPVVDDSARADAPLVVTLPRRFNLSNIDHEDYYFTQLVLLALEKTRSTHGPFEIAEHSEWLSDNRLKASIKRGLVSVAWFNSSEALEKELVPVRFSLLRDLASYRLLLIRTGDQQRFSQVKNLGDLRQFTGGMGSQWADADIMRANELPLVSSIGFTRLFRMLAAGRFDYFSRGVYQINREAQIYRDLGITIEQELMLYYPSAYYFFVAPENTALADRLLEGLQKAEADGSFQVLFLSIPRHQWALAELEKNQRRVITLEARPLTNAPSASTTIETVDSL